MQYLFFELFPDGWTQAVLLGSGIARIYIGDVYFSVLASQDFFFKIGFLFLLPSTWGLLLSWAKALGFSGLPNDLTE